MSNSLNYVPRSTMLVIILALSGCFIHSAADALDVALEPSAGLAGYSDDAKLFAGAGVIAGGRLVLVPDGAVRIVFAGDIGFHPAGQEDEVVDRAASLTLLAGPRLAFGSSAESKASVEFGVGLGRTALGWDYTPDAEAILLTDSDALGAWVIQPEASLLVGVSEQLAISMNGSYGILSWDDETSEGFSADSFDGNQYKFTIGLRIGL